MLSDLQLVYMGPRNSTELLKINTTKFQVEREPVYLASMLNTFFIDKINTIRAEFPLLESNLPSYSFTSMDSIMPECTAVLDHFEVISKPELVKIISCMHKTTCSSDPFPTKLLMDHLEAIIDTILHIVNLSLTTAVFPSSCN